jgi:hypothetical protein
MGSASDDQKFKLWNFGDDLLDGIKKERKVSLFLNPCNYAGYRFLRVNPKFLEQFPAFGHGTKLIQIDGDVNLLDIFMRVFSGQTIAYLMRCGHNFSGMTENHTLPEIQSGRLPVITGSDHSMPESGQDSGERIIILMAVDDIDMLAGDNLF